MKFIFDMCFFPTSFHDSPEYQNLSIGLVPFQTLILKAALEGIILHFRFVVPRLTY